MRLNYQLGFGVVLAEDFGGAAFFALEDAVEVGDVVESTFVAYFGDCLGGVDEGAGCMAYAYIYYILREGAPRAQLEEAAEGSRRHAGQGSHVVEVDGFGVVAVDGFLNLEDAA